MNVRPAVEDDLPAINVEVARLPEVGWKHGRLLDLVLLQRVLATRPDAASLAGGEGE